VAEVSTPIDFRLQPLIPGGDIVASKRFASQPVVLYFWATWCGPCKAIGPEIDALGKEYQPKNVAFVAVSTEEKQIIRAYEEASPHRNMMVLNDPKRDLSSLLNIQSLPTVVVLDKNHGVVHTEQGFLPGESTQNIRRAIESVL
jgi:thiol-disulfide isomerase/thioredoxin